MTENNQKKYTFHISGMHCNACVLMTESELSEISGVTHVKTSLQKNTVEILGDFGEKNKEEILTLLNAPLVSHGYTLSSYASEENNLPSSWKEFKVAIPLAILFISLFFAMQKAGLVNLIGGGELTYFTAFVVGVVASLSSCMAVVGGLLLSMSATFAKEDKGVKSQVLFHVGRILSFFIFGGVIGVIGSLFTISPTSSFVVGIGVAIVMLVLGINLLDIFPSVKKFQVSMPKFLSRRALGVSKMSTSLTPFLVGVATFFLPCGFTQSMQLYALGTGHFMTGALTMFFFSLGTLPVLSLLSFGSFSFAQHKNRGVFFKTIGLVVIMFASFTFINSLVAMGFISPVFTF